MLTVKISGNERVNFDVLKKLQGYLKIGGLITNRDEESIIIFSDDADKVKEIIKYSEEKFNIGFVIRKSIEDDSSNLIRKKDNTISENRLKPKIKTVMLIDPRWDLELNRLEKRLEKKPTPDNEQTINGHNISSIDDYISFIKDKNRELIRMINTMRTKKYSIKKKSEAYNKIIRLNKRALINLIEKAGLKKDDPALKIIYQRATTACYRLVEQCWEKRYNKLKEEKIETGSEFSELELKIIKEKEPNQLNELDIKSYFKYGFFSLKASRSIEDLKKAIGLLKEAYYRKNKPFLKCTTGKRVTNMVFDIIKYLHEAYEKLITLSDSGETEFKQEILKEMVNVIPIYERGKKIHFQGHALYIRMLTTIARLENRLDNPKKSLENYFKALEETAELYDINLQNGSLEVMNCFKRLDQNVFAPLVSKIKDKESIMYFQAMGERLEEKYSQIGLKNILQNTNAIMSRNTGSAGCYAKKTEFIKGEKDGKILYHM